MWRIKLFEQLRFSDVTKLYCLVILIGPILANANSNAAFQPAG